jgi:hypothetical protein
VKLSRTSVKQSERAHPDKSRNERSRPTLAYSARRECAERALLSCSIRRVPQSSGAGYRFLPRFSGKRQQPVAVRCSATARSWRQRGSRNGADLAPASRRASGSK